MWGKRDCYYAEIFLVLLSLYPNTKALLFSQSLPNTQAFIMTDLDLRDIFDDKFKESWEHVQRNRY
jgi:hypothetical protein